MKRRRAAVAVVSTLLVALLTLLLRGSDHEPRYQGKTLSAWLLQGAWKPIGLTRAQEEAVRSMGTNALPFLLKWVQYESPPWRVRFAMSASRVVGRFWVLFRDERMERARFSLASLQMLGPDVSPAMPELMRMLKQTNAVVAGRALQVVDSVGKVGIPVLMDVLTNRQAYSQVYYLEGAMGRLGEDGRFAVPALVGCLTNKSWGVSVVAARWLGRIRMEPEITVPALASSVDAPDARVRCATIQALGEFRTGAVAALPFVAGRLSDPDNGVRWAARECLRSIGPDFLNQEGADGQGF